MVKILMVCLGNICRSPLAEGILRSKVDKNYIRVDSAGTGGWHIGELPDPRSIQVANEHNLDITSQRCRKFKYSDFDEFDLIYAMDKSNLNDIRMMARSNENRQKVYLILELIYPNQFRDVPDPYYDGEDGFENVFQMLDTACGIIANKLS
jgi:protein-tyrosine phosphatase